MLAVIFLLFIQETLGVPLFDDHLSFRYPINVQKRENVVINNQKSSADPPVNDRFNVEVIDAGSTSTKLSAYTFTKATNGNMKLDEARYEKINVAFGKLGNNESEARAQTRNVVLELKALVKSDELKNTMVYFRATAGIRQLPKVERHRILDIVRKELKQSEFRVPDNAVEAMKGEDEGKFQWITVNFLLSLATPAEAQKTVNIMEIGGGSAQFASGISSLRDALICETSKINAIFRPLGLSLSRMSILRNKKLNKGQCVNDKILYRSPCFHHNYVSTASYSNCEISVAGPEEAIDDDERFSKCLTFVSKRFKDMFGDDRIKADLSGNTYVLGAPYFIARAAGMIKKEGGKIPIKMFTTKGKEECANVAEDTSKGKYAPFRCIDIAYIYTLLRHFGFEDSTVVSVHRKIQKHKLAWSLGFSLWQLASKERRENKQCSSMPSDSSAPSTLTISADGANPGAPVTPMVSPTQASRVIQSFAGLPSIYPWPQMNFQLSQMANAWQPSVMMSQFAPPLMV